MVACYECSCYIEDRYIEYRYSWFAEWEALHMKTTKRLWPFVLADNRLAEAYLQEQAAKGLILDHFGLWGFMASYRIEEPQQRFYCIDGFKGDKDEQGRYIRMAKDGGWEYVTELPGHIFFISEEGENPVPTQTDWREEYLQIRKSLWSFEMPVGIMLLAFFVLLIWIDPTGFITTMLSSPRVICIYIFGSIGFIKAALFYLKSEIALRRDIPIGKSNWKQALFWGYTRAIAGLATFSLMILNGIVTATQSAQGGDWLTDASLLMMAAGTALYIASGVIGKNIDDLGRTVYHADENTKKLKKLSKILIVVGFVIYILT